MRFLLIFFFLAALIPGSYSFATEYTFEITWSVENTADVELAGFRLYDLDQHKVCETTDPQATTMPCSVTTDSTEGTYTLVSYSANDIESDPSTPFTILFIEPTPLEAVITLTVADGSQTVYLDATQSTGSISKFTWEFNDGSPNSFTAATTHTYPAAGTYTISLTVEDESGETASATREITLNQIPGSNQPPVAALAVTSDVMGDSPLTVSFDAGASTDPEGASLTYSWDFGDGTTTTGSAQTTHQYVEAGTYTATVSVTDNQGASDSTTSQPILVNTGSDEPNDTLPTAVISAGRTNGVAPVPITFSGSNSTPSQSASSITEFSWNFGDGSTGSGQETVHTFSDPGIYSVQLTVTDDKGATTKASMSVTVNSEPSSQFRIELGELDISQDWTQVQLTESFSNPVVLVSPSGFNESDPVVIRMRNVTSSSFEIRLQEWDYLDGGHATETIHYMVIEQGHFTLDDGTQVEAGSFIADTAKVQPSYSQSFQSTPVLLTSIATFNEQDTVTGRVQNTSANGFDYRLQEQQANRISHSKETIFYLAWDQGTGSTNALQYQAATSGNVVTQHWKTLAFTDNFTEKPFAFAAMQTTNGSDTAALRYRDLSATGMDVKVEEEQSYDDELFHNSEDVGYLLITPSTPSAPVAPQLHLEVGEIDINQEWTRVELSKSFSNPVVLVGPVEARGADPTVIRLRNVTASSFEIRLQEWDYLDGGHTTETVHYMAIEQGRFTLDDGSQVEVGSFEADTTSQYLAYTQPFQSPPVVLTSIATYNEQDAVTGRIKNSSTDGFNYRLQEQQANSASHAQETIFYLAWEQGTGSTNSLRYLTGTTGDVVTNNWTTIPFAVALPANPFAFAAMQTEDGSDTAALRYRDLSSTGMDIKVEEEQSYDDEVGHTSENIGYIIFSIQ